MKQSFAAYFLIGLSLGTAAPSIFAAPSSTDLDNKLGVPLFADDSLWDDEAQEVAKRLRWPAESSTKEQSSFRQYPNAEAKFCGARPYSLALYARDGKPERISVVFTNKGDFGNYFSIAQSLAIARGSDRTALQKQSKEILRDFPKALEADENAVSTALTSLLGNPSPSKVSLNGSAAEKVKRWDWQGHAFLLSTEPDGFVGLQIVSVTSLDENAGVARQRDSDLKSNLLSRLQKRDNGDVVIGELPMVDQGPKGFCVPATLERCFRYLGIHADMYMLALKAQTGMGGGTGLTDIFVPVNDLARANGRRFEKVPGNLRLNNIARFIDDGLPIMWGMNARDDIEKDVTDRSVQRKATTDPAIWKKVLKNVKKPKVERTALEPAGHMCLITGYNKSTEEIAISDSWGPEFAERWITEDELAVMSLNFAAVIGF